MLEFFADNFSDCIFLAVFLVAMIPAVESKIAIPFALSVPIWGDMVLSPFLAGLIAFLGTMLPSIFVVWFARKFKNKTSGFVYKKFFSKVEDRYKVQFEKLGQKNSNLKKCLMLSTFVAVPLPLTGVYTGSLIAGFTNLKLWQCFLSILVGEIVSCFVVVLLCVMFENSAFYILLFSIVILALYLFANFVLRILRRTARKS